jgi:hypothetical protein
MVRKAICDQALPVAVSFASVANASRYDDCILNAIKGNTSEAAAISITRACLHSSQQTLNSDALSHITGTAEYVAGNRFGEAVSNSLHLRLKNGSEYQLTSITTELHNIKSGSTSDYTQSEFYLPFGKFNDPTKFLSISPGEVRDYFMSIAESEPSEGAFFKRYSWEIVSAKGVTQ